MLLTTDPVAERLADALQLRVDHIGRKRVFDAARRLALARLLLDNARGRFPRHRDDPNAVAISALELRRRLRSDVASIRNDLLRLVSTFEEGDFDVAGRKTRAITFHAHLVQQAMQVYRDAATAPLAPVARPST